MAETVSSSKRYHSSSQRLAATSIPVLDLANKTVLPKTLSLNQELALDSKDIKEIKAIIDLMKKHDLSVFEIEKEGFRLKLQRGASASQSATAAPAAAWRSG